MAFIHPFRALRPAPENARRGLLRSLRRRQHRRSARARRRQSAQLPARHPVRDRSAAGHRSVFAARSTRRRARTSTRCAAHAPLVDRGRRRRSISTGCGWAAHEQTGVAGCFSVDEYEHDVIKKHERTRRDKEDDRTRHMIELRAQTGVVFLTYSVDAAIDRLAQRGHRRRAALRLHRGRRRAPHDLAARRRRDRGSWSTRSRRFPRCTSPTATTAPRARRARAPSCGTRGDARARRTRSSPWRFPTTRCRSCRTTARCKDLAGRTPAAVPRGAAAAVSRSPTAAARRAGKGEVVDVSRRPVVHAGSLAGGARRTSRARAASTSRCCSTTCSSSS